MPSFDWKAVQKHILIHYRWVFVVLFLLPLSALYDIYFYVRSWLIFRVNSAPRQHGRRLQHVQRQVKAWHDSGQQQHMCTARPGWQTISFRQAKYKQIYTNISINMIDILELDTQKQTVWCEPLVTMGQLTATLVELGWTVPVVPEMDDLTIGGLVMGSGIETSSHKAGLFQHSCVSFELVLADGSAVTCSETENAELFYSVPWSYGTLGFLTAVEIKIVPAKRFVRLEYRPCNSPAQLLQEFSDATKREDGNQFVEAICFTRETAVVMVGNMVDSAEPGKVNCIGRWHMPWFFKHVESFLSSGTAVEYLPIRDYYHRHTRSIFWEIQDIIPFGNNVVFRWLLGWLVPPKVSLLKLTQSQAIKELYENNHFIQDMLVPLDRLGPALDCFHQEVQIYPIWLCPFLLPSRPGMLQSVGDEDRFYVDIGTYGVPHVADFKPVETTRRVEKFVRENNGFQMLYADSYLTREEFRQMFDHKLYDKLRQQLPETTKAFPEVYDKVNRNARI
uniref:Delta(24)-sterol reductase n=2 Tax=Hirondellea gigas TaxID=1518452 RepID=A0A2P2HY56_9CRUS